jgi:hypothetical protein
MLEEFKRNERDLKEISFLIKENKIKKLREFENYIIYKYNTDSLDPEEKLDLDSKLIIFGEKTTELNLLNILKLITEKENSEKISKDFELKKDYPSIIYTVSFLTLDSLRSYKYTETLNLPSFIFKSREESIKFLIYIDELKYNVKENYYKITKMLLDQI